jgi:multiple sugar transport system permease protein
MAFLLAVVFVPFIWAIGYSLTSISFASARPMGFIGLENYHKLMKDDVQFGNSIILSVIFTVLVVSIELVLGVALAVLANREFKGKRWVTTLFITPTMMAPIAVGLTWRFILIPTYGVGMYWLNRFGFFTTTTVFAGKLSAFLALAFIDVWQWTPFMFLLALAGLSSLPQEPFEAAAIDGARPWQIFTRITIPLLKPIIIIAVLFRSLDAFKVFDKIFMITQGGPGNATELISMYTYRINFLHWHLGYGAAAVIVVYLLVLAVTAVFQKLTFARQT